METSGALAFKTHMFSIYFKHHLGNMLQSRGGLDKIDIVRRWIGKSDNPF